MDKFTETIEDVFDKKEITGSVFIDLTAAYDTVWHQGLRLKLQRMLTSNHLINFIMELLYTRSFTLFTSDEQKSRSFRLKNDVAQGFVLAPTLYNIYTADFPKTSGNCFMYADDVAITYSESSIAKVVENLSNDMKTICQYLHDWHLKLSQSKTVSLLDHLKNHLALKSIKVTLDHNTILNCERYPTYLEITLDRSLTYKNHLHKLKQKVSSRVALVRKLSGTNWGTSFDTIRTSTTALVFAPAEYCVPVCCQSTHTKTLDMKQCGLSLLHPPHPFEFFTTTLGNTATKLSPEKLCKRLYYRADNTDHLLHNILYSKTPPKRLKSRKLFRPFLESPQDYDPQQEPIPHKLQPHIQD